MTKKKKPDFRMLKVQCPSCKYVVRTTAKWLRRGRPSCPCNDRPMRLVEKGVKPIHKIKAA
jgi:hypothetical protein